MVNEAILVVRLEDPMDYVVADGTGIEKGALLGLTDGMVAILASADKQVLAGIARREKIANDGKVTIPVYMGGIFKGVAGAAVAIGIALMTDATANKLETSTGVTGASQLGYALEAPSGDNQTFIFRLNVGGSGAIA